MYQVLSRALNQEEDKSLPLEKLAFQGRSDNKQEKEMDDSSSKSSLWSYPVTQPFHSEVCAQRQVKGAAKTLFLF